MWKRNISFKILLLIIILFISTGFQCQCASNAVKKDLAPITLEYWGVWDDSDVFDDLIAKYTLNHPNITVKYKKIRYEEYEMALLEGWADGRGPDIFSIHNTWIPKYKDKITPLPKVIELPYITYKPPLPGCSKKTEQVIEKRKTDIISFSDLRNNYTETVYYDSVFKGDDGKNHIYALPLYLDTLALFYNRDLLDKANIPFPPADWDEFIEDVRLLTRYDINRNIVQSGAALGTFDNIERSFDIISLLMLQNGVDLASFADKSNLKKTIEALEFYLDFASPERETYTWDDKQVNSLDAFAEGKTAFFFGYSYHIPRIKQKAPILNFSVSQIPQVNLSSPVNYASYWTQTVFRRSKHTKEAWDFILFLSQEKNLKEYLKETKKPTVVRSLIKWQEEDRELKPFASQVLTAKSWHNIYGVEQVETNFAEIFEGLHEDPIISLGKGIERARSKMEIYKK